MTAEEAFKEFDGAEALGLPLYASYRHFDMAENLRERGNLSSTFGVLAIWWVMSHNPDRLKALQREWRQDPDGVLDRLDEIREEFNLVPGSERELEAGSAAARFYEAIDASRESPDSDDEGGEDDDGPGK